MPASPILSRIADPAARRHAQAAIAALGAQYRESDDHAPALVLLGFTAEGAPRGEPRLQRLAEQKTYTFDPPPEPGTLFIVAEFDRRQGKPDVEIETFRLNAVRP